MRIGVYGGSFNPPHVGHAMVASWVLWTEQADEVWLMPTFAHAFSKQLAPFEDRMAMLREVCAALGAGARVDPLERDLPSPSYTIDTLDELARRHPEHQFHLICGSDTLDDTDSWKDWDRIERDYRPIIAGRAGYREIAGVPSFPGVSSTDVRRRLAAGESVDRLVPAGVLRLAAALYR